MANTSKNTEAPISLPKGGGAIKGIGETFQPNLFSGTGNISVPILTSDLVPHLVRVSNDPERWMGRDGDVHWRATTKENITSIMAAPRRPASSTHGKNFN